MCAVRIIGFGLCLLAVLLFMSEEKEKVEEILKPYQGLAATEELKKKIWDVLQKAKYEGRITIPFKVVSRKDIYKKYPDCIEIILDTKV